MTPASRLALAILATLSHGIPPCLAQMDAFKAVAPGSDMKLRVIGPAVTIPRKPDLVVTSCVFTPASAPQGAQNISVEVHYRNAGNANAVIYSGLAVWQLTGPASVGGVGGANVNAAYDIPPGVARFGGVRWPQLGNLTPGTYAFTAMVEPDNRVEEANESNNQMPCSLTITAPPSRSDLVISSMTLNPAQPSTNSAFNLEVTIRNQGEGPAVIPPSTYILSGAPHAGSALEYNGSTLNPGGTKTYLMGATGDGAQRGTRTWTIRLDPNSRVPETNESNNEGTISVTVR